MAVRLGQTRDGASRLLKTVGGKPHATGQDHEHAHHNQDTPQDRPRLHECAELDLTREPQSSGDERLRTPPKPSRPAPTEDALRQPSSSTRKRKAEPPSSRSGPGPEPGLRKPPRTKPRSAAAQGAALRVPKIGQFEQSRAAKVRLGGDKEDTAASAQHVWGFGMSSQPEQKGPKVTFGRASKTKNIHAAPLPTKKRTNDPTNYGSQSNKKTLALEPEGSEPDLSTMGDDELHHLGISAGMEHAKPEEPGDPELRTVAPGKKRRKAPRTDADAADSSAMNKAELDRLLRPTRPDHLDLTSDTPDSCLPDSSAPQQEMDHIDSYMRELPAPAEEGTECAICNEPVTQQDYWHFWKGRKKTVKNQAAFCHGHKKATAQREYDAERLPLIQWDELPKRIKKHRMSLHGILTGDVASTYRARYEPLALTGKAAAVPSKRADLSPSKQAQLASYALDDNAVYPGYYGPRGRRLITESVMALLSKPIQRCSDPVVQASGPATFVQAVLVPEVAIRLIMEDCRCDWDAAEERRERTFDMGLLLNEEIEDHVDVPETLGDESEGEEEEENDHHH
ncbi:uncharacterized protein EKO05_0001918 [Ascochyta rabiei]|uniref:uncharacterized protein n=1 Tax=Didymella rabiei TaxID=5454 RepID=UPI0019017C8B|nr:uncharacterized protein EKO05_0001918 [Ascochyta rabiei]UPX11308.1 hypothetical protein EKO05_0001918 [Ascochyta rabiei]